MAGMDLVVKGLELFNKEVESADKRMQAANVPATRAGCNVVKRKAKANIHSTGETHGDPSKEDLARHVAVRIYKKRPTNSIGLVGPLFPGQTPQQKSYYGDWVEKGHKMEFGDGTVLPHPWLRPALDESKSEVNAKMAKAYKNALEKKLNPADLLNELGENLVDTLLSGGGSEGPTGDYND